MDLNENVSCQFMLFTGYNVKHLRPMRWYSLLLILSVLLVGPVVDSQAQVATSTPSLRLATRQFQAPDGMPYLEVQAEFLGNSVTWLAEGDSVFRAAVRWTVIAYDSAGTVAGFVKSTARTGPLLVQGDFVDVARMELAPGPHVLELEVEDIGAPERQHLEYETVVDVSRRRSSTSVTCSWFKVWLPLLIHHRHSPAQARTFCRCWTAGFLLKPVGFHSTVSFTEQRMSLVHQVLFWWWLDFGVSKETRDGPQRPSVSLG